MKKCNVNFYLGVLLQKFTHAYKVICIQRHFIALNKFFFRLINLQSRKKIKVPFTPVTIAIEASAWDYVIK